MLPSDESSLKYRNRRRFAALVLTAGVTGLLIFLWNRQAEPPPEDPQPVRTAQGDRQSDKRAPSPDEPWETEEFGKAAADQLKQLSTICAGGKLIAADELSKLAVVDVACGALRPKDLLRAFADESVTIFRMASAESSPIGDARGLAGLQSALNEMLRPLGDSAAVNVHFKIVRVDLQADSAETKILVRVDLQPDSAATKNLVHAGGHGRGSTVQQNATWQCRWRRSTSQSPPLLERIEVLEYEEVVANRPNRMFVDCTEAVFAVAPVFKRQLLPGVDYWRRRIQADFDVGLHGHEGIAVGDANGDGLDDLYVCQPRGLPNRLFLQNRDGTVTEAAAKAGIDWLDRCRGALFVDLDNDGDQDLTIAMNVNLMVLSNDGTGRFTERAVVYLPGDPHSLSAADYDLDGDLDLYVTGYGSGFLQFEREESQPDAAVPYPYHDANNGSPNALLRNDGNWTFTDATRSAGLDRNNRRWSFAAAWEDFDNDGDPDLYVANDYGRNNLYRNDGGRFVDIAAEAGVEDIAAGMSVSWADYDGDGRMDLYVGNMFSSAGGRIAYQRRFQPAAGEEVRGQFQRHARGNTLFKNVGNGTFHDVSVEAGVTLGRWAWGSKFIDLNNDGREDLFVANGYITGPDTDDL